MTTLEGERERVASIGVSKPRGTLRTERVSRALRDVAKLARSPAAAWLGTGSGVKPRWHAAFIYGSIGSFILLVALPVLVASVYLGLIASPQYASEARFAVRGGERTPFESTSALSFLTGMPQAQRVQDSLILYEYLRGRGVVEDLDREVHLRRLLGNPNADYFSRFSVSEPMEELVRYWKWHEYIGYDSQSSTITLIVQAFTPEDALKIAGTAITLSENLVNDLSERARRDALALASASLKRAEDNLESKSQQLRDLRNAEGVLDATKTADLMVKMVGDLRLELIHLQQEYDIQRRTVSASSPQLQVQQARITSLREQIQKMEDQMTNSRTPTGVAVTGTSASGNSAPLSNVMSRFDRQELEREIAQKQLVAAAAAFERARLELEGKHVYVATFLQPVLAQEALFPRRWWLWSIVLVSCLSLWGALLGIGVLVRNYIAV